MNETNTHVYFYGSIYSQWAPCEFYEGDLKFNCSEQYMMYHKAIVFGDIKSANKIMATDDPSKQKAIGRKIKGFTDNKWNLFKKQIVYCGNYLKFTQNGYFKKTLLEDHKDKIIVEGSPTDKVWGVGLSCNDPAILDESNWNGENLLGKAIMDVRESLLNELVYD